MKMNLTKEEIKVLMHIVKRYKGQIDKEGSLFIIASRIYAQAKYALETDSWSPNLSREIKL